MSIGSLLKKNRTLAKDEHETVHNIRFCDILTDRFKTTLLADYKNESSRTKYPEVDGENVLGVLSGIFFVPDGVSVNERFYPRLFWEDVLKNPEVQNRIRDRIMFGTIGHEDKFVDDEDLAQGKVSHIITKLWIDEETGMGMGEALILGTDSGKNLYRILKAGSKIKISSRAYGDYVQGKFHEGMPIMDAKTYKLEGFDVVLCPGFPQTKLCVYESTRNNNERNKLIIESVIKRRSESMANEQTNKTVKPSAKTEESLLTKELNRSRAKAESQVNVLEKKVKDLSDKLEAATSECNTWKDESGKLLRSYTRYNSLGTIPELKAKLEKLQQYESISPDPEDIKKTIVEATSRINKGKELFEMLSEAGSAIDMTESAINQYLEVVGTVAEARRNKIKTERALKQYTAFGTISDIAAMADKCSKMEEKLKQEKLESDCRKFSTVTGQSIETVQRIFESAKSREDAIKILNTMKPSKEQKSESKLTFKKESVIENKNNKVLEKRKNESAQKNSDVELSKQILRRCVQ